MSSLVLAQAHFERKVLLPALFQTLAKQKLHRHHQYLNSFLLQDTALLSASDSFQHKSASAYALMPQIYFSGQIRSMYRDLGAFQSNYVATHTRGYATYHTLQPCYVACGSTICTSERRSRKNLAAFCHKWSVAMRAGDQNNNKSHRKWPNLPAGSEEDSAARQNMGCFEALI